MESKVYKVKGMHCASCASIIERVLKKKDGVDAVEVNYGTEKAKLTFDASKVSAHDLSKHIEPLGYTLDIPTSAKEMGMSLNEHAAHLGLGQSKAEKLAELKNMWTMVLSALPLAIFSIFVMGWDILAEFGVVTEMGETLYEFFHHLLPI